MCMLQQISPWKHEKKTFDAALFCFSDGRYSSLPVITMSVAAESISVSNFRVAQGRCQKYGKGGMKNKKWHLVTYLAFKSGHFSF